MLEVGKIYIVNEFYVLPIKIKALDNGDKVCEYIGLEFFYESKEYRRDYPVWLTLSLNSCLYIDSHDEEVVEIPDSRYYITSLFGRGLRIN